MATRALVLGGGGPVGIAWESGLIAGLEAGGVRLADADLIIGTSAGSVVGVQLALGSSGSDLESAQRQQASRAPTIDVSQRSQTGAPDLTPLMQLFASRPSGDEAQQLNWRKRVGDYALNAKTIEASAFIQSFGRVSAAGWPTRDFRCTAIDASSGAFKCWSANDHVNLGAAVASSCAVPGVYPCIPIAGIRYYDGGLRSATNADLAAGYDRVIVISLMAANAMGPTGSSNPLDAEVELLKRRGSHVEVISADEASRTAFGPNLMDARRRLGALDAGVQQGKSAAAMLSAFW